MYLISGFFYLYPLFLSLLLFSFWYLFFLLLFPSSSPFLQSLRKGCALPKAPLALLQALRTEGLLISWHLFTFPIIDSRKPLTVHLFSFSPQLGTSSDLKHCAVSGLVDAANKGGLRGISGVRYKEEWVSSQHQGVVT